MSSNKSPRVLGSCTEKIVSRNVSKVNVKLDSKRSVNIQITHIHAKIPGLKYNNGVFYRGTHCELVFRTHRGLKEVNADPKQKDIVEIFHGDSWLNPHDIRAWENFKDIRRFANFNFEKQGMEWALRTALRKAEKKLNITTPRPEKLFSDEQVHKTQLQIWRDENRHNRELWKLDKSLIWAALLPAKHHQIEAQVNKRINELAPPKNNISGDIHVVTTVTKLLGQPDTEFISLDAIVRYLTDNGWKCATAYPHDYVRNILKQNKHTFREVTEQGTVSPKYRLQDPPKEKTKLHKRRAKLGPKVAM